MTTETKTTNTNPKFHTEPMEGYKAFDKNLCCRNDFQYEIGKTYTMDEEPEICDHGFHFCKNIADCYRCYGFGSRICKVRAEGLTVGDNEDDFNQSQEYCTNKITILEKVTDESLLHANTDNSLIGYCNTGIYNTGSRNTGDWNTGYYNTGNRNSGICNTGDRNTGDRNTGYCNVGDRNTGIHNTGNWNTGDRNTGDRNTGYWNTGDRNTGNCNTGIYNTGNCNTGDWNTCSHSAGCFCTEEPTIRLFNKESNWIYQDWILSKARDILQDMPSQWTELTWVSSDFMNDKEKEKHPEYKTTDGYLKSVKHRKSRQVWWNSLSDEDKKTVMELPNFDADIFKECTGIDVNQK